MIVYQISFTLCSPHYVLRATLRLKGPGMCGPRFGECIVASHLDKSEQVAHNRWSSRWCFPAVFLWVHRQDQPTVEVRSRAVARSPFCRRSLQDVNDPG